MKIIACGDSITEGLGVRKQKSDYGKVLANLVQENVSDEVVFHNFATSGIQISKTIERLTEIIDMEPNLVLIMHGITEAIVRPNNKFLNFFPKRYHIAGRLDPRPYFSSKFYKRLLQELESSIRWRMKNFLITIDGGVKWKTKDDFHQELFLFVNSILKGTNADILLISHCGIDTRFFPKSLVSLEEYKQVLQGLSTTMSETRRVHYCDISNLLDQWNDYFADHFHPNLNGHEKIANKVFSFLKDNNILQNKV